MGLENILFQRIKEMERERLLRQLDSEAEDFGKYQTTQVQAITTNHPNLALMETHSTTRH